jgi:pyruvate/2-oxoglutarate dehydrogenase complex dihydrolipoamide dehydrogenase (E3) component
VVKKQLVVIGAGPGGYPAAFLAADLGMQVTLIDQRANPGGECLYCGCIPSKALLHIAKVLTESREAARWGVTFGEPKVDIDRVRAWKDNVVQKLTGGLGQLCKTRQINYIQGRAKFVDPHTVNVRKMDGHHIGPAHFASGLGLDFRTGAEDRSEDATGHRRRLHRARTGIRLRSPGFQGHSGRNDAGPSARGRS